MSGPGYAGIIAIAAPADLYKLVTEGWGCYGGVSLVGYDISILGLGYYLPGFGDELSTRIRDAGFCETRVVGLRHSGSVDAIRKRALYATRQFSAQSSTRHEINFPKDKTPGTTIFSEGFVYKYSLNVYT